MDHVFEICFACEPLLLVLYEYQSPSWFSASAELLDQFNTLFHGILEQLRMPT